MQTMILDRFGGFFNKEIIMINADQLSKFKLFSDISPEKLAAIALKCDVLEFGTNDVIFKDGDEATNIYGVLDGEVTLSLIFEDKVLKTNIDYEESILSQYEVLEKPIVVDVVSRGEIFGWSALVSPHTSTATATCTMPVKVFAIPAETLCQMFQKDATLGFAVMSRLSELISQRLRNRTAKLIETWGAAFGIDEV